MTCPTGKRPFDSRRQVKTFLQSKGLARNRVYRCPDCSLWHHTRAGARVVAWYREHR